MEAIELLLEQVKWVHWWIETTIMATVTPEQAHWYPPGTLVNSFTLHRAPYCRKSSWSRHRYLSSALLAELKFSTTGKIQKRKTKTHDILQKVLSETYRRPIAIFPRFHHYGWGDSEFIPLLFGLAPGDVPYAEAWLGAHKVAPSSAMLSGEEQPLDQLIASNPEDLLGHACQSGFGELPYLVKLLSAAQPLSIQVHPSKSEAIAGYRRESAAMIPLNSARRNYRDSNSKPEILIALTPFWALAGFRPAAEIATAIKGIRSLARLLPPFDSKPDWLERLVAVYFGLSESVLVPALTEWVEMLADSSDTFGQHTWEFWALRCHRLFQRDGRPDRGVFFVPLLNLIRLERWQALFLDPGTPHAYLLGSGIEVMANSDNVLRGGLTPKHVDVDEFLRS